MTDTTAPSSVRSSDSRPRKLLALCDSPTARTGFGRVASNLLARWQESGFFDEIHVFAIGYRGNPHPLPYRMWPAAGFGNPDIWWERENLQRFLVLCANQDFKFTHVWMMHDPFTLNPLTEPLKEMASDRREYEKQGSSDTVLPRIWHYFPVDGRQRMAMQDIVRAVDHPVSYTEWGKGETLRAFEADLRSKGVKGRPLKGAIDHQRGRIAVAPHGVDTSIYRPLPSERRLAVREQYFGENLAPDDFLLVNVNAHQKRKGILQSLEILRELRDRDPERAERYKLYLHMPSINQMEGTNLLLQASDLGFPPDSGAVFYGDPFFRSGHPGLDEHQLNEIYNCADLVLSTSHGEGWGLTITEAMAAGRPVAAPMHTAMHDYFDDEVGIPLVADRNVILTGDNNIPRPVVNPEIAADRILDAIESDSLDRLGAAARDRMRSSDYDWQVIANQWLEWFAR